jgi:hypothetical protein
MYRNVPINSRAPLSTLVNVTDSKQNTWEIRFCLRCDFLLPFINCFSIAEFCENGGSLRLKGRCERERLTTIDTHVKPR